MIIYEYEYYCIIIKHFSVGNLWLLENPNPSSDEVDK